METKVLATRRLPLSLPGSLLGISAETRVDPGRFFIRSLHRFDDPREMLAIGLEGSGPAGSVVLTAERLSLHWDGASVEAVFSGPDSIRLRATGAPGTLACATPDARTTQGDDGVVLVRFPSRGLEFRIRPVGGNIVVDGDRIVFGARGGGGEIAIEEVCGEPDPGGAFDHLVAARGAEFEAWFSRIADRHPGLHRDALREAAYLLWCCQAGPRGALRRRAVYMSKNWMTGIWSWDNCFNAVALAKIDPALAWDQFAFFFDHQADDGRLPDLVTFAGADWGMTKPPVYGWALRRLRAADPYFRAPERLQEVYEPMARQARFWLETRDPEQDGLPGYHHGCDSGWDNGTAFLGSPPHRSPDLAAWLILQLEELAEIAPLAGRPGDVARWLAAADRTAEAMGRRCWDGRRWTAVPSQPDQETSRGDCLLPWLAGMAGHRMTVPQRDAVVAALGEEGRFLGPCGMATEAMTSPLFEADGYWRGPVWGPSTVMAVEACTACGAPGLASEIVRRFSAIAPAHGFAENHDAVTGRGLRDPGYTWTASAWLLLNEGT